MRVRKLFFLLIIIGAALVAGPGPGVPAQASLRFSAQERPRVVVLDATGPVVPVMAHYIARGIERAEEERAVCLIRLNTPGGLYTVTQGIVGRIVNARTPVIVYVSPAGSWAASAGSFIAMGAHVAAMAPGSRIGAAHPVAVGEEQEEVSVAKVTADAAAWMRSLAELRGRDAGAAAKMVTESRSFSAGEALKQRLVDVVAASEAELFKKISGRSVTLVDGRRVTLQLAGAVAEAVRPNWVERFLSAVLNPEIAYLLLTLGMIGLMVELYHPGLVFPGVAGGIALLLGLYSLGTLEAYWGGLLLIVLAFAFFVAEAFVPTHGLLGAGGVIAFFFGSVLLFSTRGGGMRLGTGLVAATSLTLAGLLALLVTAVVRGQKRRVQTGCEELVGREAVVRERLKPTGTVFVAGERWQAVLEEGAEAVPGEKVVVTGVEGLRLKVRKKF
ncbi:membrane-bound serine protease (ClpP class) [Thermodesulfitimonas autotrophica]|uniref:Membrane-bound serine protease (ClpP class) n=1 Tax=Thermodesulfitimonas autotrophica TaxID=1894989 RepID=A0A3N5B2E5_9THEO|nr:membrane-bound serine protease (ClpP class) [Thermodesulfitimonas autotrophica]